VDWLIDPGDWESTQRALSQAAEHVQRHAADIQAAEDAASRIQEALANGADRLGDGWVRMHLNWRSTAPWVGFSPVADRAVLDRLGVGLGDLVPVDRRDQLGDFTPVVRLDLDVERRLQVVFEAGPPPLVELDVDPRRDGPASAAVALSIASEVHPNYSAAQTATLAGAALADGMLTGGGAPADAEEAARVIAEAHMALGSDARVVRADRDGIELTMDRCPFGPGVARSESLCHLSAGLAGRVATRVNGAATVLLEETIARGDAACHLRVLLRSEDADEMPGHAFRWPPAGGQDDAPVPHLDLSLSLPRESGSVPVVRRLAVQALAAFGVTREDVEDVELAITEACANVIDHAADTDSYEVKVELASDECAITVLDQGTGFNATDVDEEAPTHAETGRGLALMRALVDNVAFRSEPRAGAVVHMVKSLSYDHNHPLWRRAARAGTYEELTSEE